MRWSYVAGFLLVSHSAAAEDRWDVGASIGYAAPVGYAQRGDKTSDTTSALVPFSLDASYRATKNVGAAASITYGIGAPTLCGSASECVSSLGHDVSFSVHAKLFLPKLFRFEPAIELGPGWEWMTAKLVDSGAESSRAYSGPVFVTEAGAPFRFGTRVTLGPVTGATVGTFTTARLDTPSFSRDDSGGHAMHAWLSASLRCSVLF